MRKIDVIDTVSGDGYVDFGKYQSKGHNTIDMQDLDLIDNSGDVGFTSGQVAGHETLEAYASAKGSGPEPNLQRNSHNSANKYFPGLGSIVGGAVDATVDGNNYILGFEEKRPIQDGSGRIVTLKYKLGSPVLNSPSPILEPRHLISITK